MYVDAKGVYFVSVCIFISVGICILIRIDIYVCIMEAWVHKVTRNSICQQWKQMVYILCVCMHMYLYVYLFV